MDYQSVLNEVESWPIDDQIRLVQDVWAGLTDQGEALEPGDELKRELDRRIDEMDRNPESGLTWEEVKAQILGP